MRNHDRLRNRLGLVAMVALLSLSALRCGQRAPFAIVTLVGLPAEVVTVRVQAQLGDANKLSNFSGSDPLDQFSLSFPAGSRGAVQLDVSALDKNGCAIASVMTQIELSADATYSPTLTLTPLTPPSCPATELRPLMVQKTGDGQGAITSSPAGIDCKSDCTEQSAQFALGAAVTLTALPNSAPGRNDLFIGWSGENCVGTGPCTVNLTQAATVSAAFACRGFCPENPASEQNTLYAILGSSANAITAVGDNGAILGWDGANWTRISSGVTAPLRALAEPDGSSVLFAVGDSGTILNSQDSGMSWAPMSSSVTKNLRGVWAAGTTEVYAAGDNIGTNQPYLLWNGTSWAAVSKSGFDGTYNSVAGFGSGNFLLVGNGASQVRGNNNSPIKTPGIGFTTQNLSGAWADGGFDQIAVGDAGTLVAFGESGWTALPMPSGAQPVNLHGVHGASNKKVYAVGDSGTVWRYDGIIWTAMPTGSTRDLYGVWALADGNFYVVGQGGVILHYRP